MDGPYLTAKLGASLVSLCAREDQAAKPRYPKRECTHEKPAFANGKLRGKCFDCYPKPERKQFTWVRTAARACKFCSSEFTALGPNLYCSPQCKTLQTKQMQRVKYEARRKPKKQTEFLRRCLWCLSTFSLSVARILSGGQAGWFCSRDCSFADMKLHGRSGNSGARTAWHTWAEQFKRKERCTAACADCGSAVGALAVRCAECRRLESKKAAVLSYRQKASVIRECPCCRLVWSPIDRRGPRRHCYTEECNTAFDLNQKEVRRAARRKLGGKSHQSRARRYGCAREAFNPFEVLARDRWRCQLCGIKTPQAKRGSIDDDAPELDHVVPLSKGGPHTRANTQCLCRRCNRLKSDTARGQLGLTF